MKNFLLPTKQNGTIIVQKCVNLSARRHYITIYDKSLFKWLRKFSWIYQKILLKKKNLTEAEKKLLKNTHTFPYSLDVYPWGSYNPHNPGKWKFFAWTATAPFLFYHEKLSHEQQKKKKRNEKEEEEEVKKLQRKGKKIINDIRKQQRA